MKNVVHSLIRIDNVLFARLFEFQFGRILSKLLVMASKSADGPLYLLLPVLVWIITPHLASRFLFALLIAFAIELPLYRFLKIKIKRERPFRALDGVTKRIHPPDHFSFPSGHTAGVFIIFIVALHFFPFLGLSVLIWALLVGLSRVHLGVHFPLDVVAGSLIGLSCGQVAIMIV